MLTIVVLTKNEAPNITDCLKSAQGLGELLVIDDDSDDATAELASSLGAQVIQHPLKSFAQQRNFALTQVKGDWVFFLDADERLSPQLAESIGEHMRLYPNQTGQVRRKNFAFNCHHRFGPLKADLVHRLFPSQAIQWTGQVHERAISELPVRRLKGSLKHLTYRNWSHYLQKQYNYALRWAAEAAAEGRRSSSFQAVGRGFLGFLKMMILNLGIVGGPTCWALCYYHGAYTLTKYLRLNELTSPNKCS